MPESATIEHNPIDEIMGRLESHYIVHEPSVLKTDEQAVELAKVAALQQTNSTEIEEIIVDSPEKEKGIQPPRLAIGTAGHKIILDALAQYINEPEIKSFAELRGKVFEQLKASTVYDTDTDSYVSGKYAYEKVYNTLCIAATRVHKVMREKIPTGYKAFVMNEVPIARSKEQKEHIALLKQDIKKGIFDKDQVVNFQKTGKYVTKEGTTISDQQLMKAIYEQKRYAQILKQNEKKPVDSTPIAHVAWPFEEVSYDDAKKLVSVLSMTVDKVGDNINFSYSNEARLDSWIFYYKEGDTYSLENLQQLAEMKSKAYFQGTLLDFVNENSQNPVIKSIWNAMPSDRIKLDIFELKIQPDKDVSKYDDKVKDQEDAVSIEHKRHAAHQMKAMEQLIHAHNSDEIIFEHIFNGVLDKVGFRHQNVKIPMLYPEEMCNMKKPPYNFGIANHVLFEPPVDLNVRDLIEQHQDTGEDIARRHGYLTEET